MARKSNKTSHVLNLITNGAPAEPEPKETETPEAGASGAGTAGAGAEASGGGSAAAQAGVAPASGKGDGFQNSGKGQEPAAPSGQTGDRKVIVVDASENDKIADAIRERLEEQVEREAGNTDTPAQKEAPTVPIENGVLDADALMDAVDSMMPEAMDMMTKAEEKAEAAEAAKAAEAARMAEAAATDAIGEAAGAATEKKVKGPHYHMVNVMEEVVNRYDLSGQMAKYGVCNCSRCHADVQALTLTHLPSKYVVVDGNPIAPIIGYYESKYRSRLLTEVMKACILVKDKPRHNRNNVTPEMLE